MKLYLDRYGLSVVLPWVAEQAGCDVEDLQIKRDPHPGAPGHLVAVFTPDEDVDHWPDADLGEPFRTYFWVEVEPQGWEGSLVLFRQSFMAGRPLEPTIAMVTDLPFGLNQFIAMVDAENPDWESVPVADGDLVVARWQAPE